jgi:lysophospholipase-3
MAPEFPITCIIGSDIRTPETSFHGKNGLDEQLDIVYVDRDGTMRMASLVAIEKLWEKINLSRVERIGGISHTSILQNDTALGEITREISCINSDAISTVV